MSAKNRPPWRLAPRPMLARVTIRGKPQKPVVTTRFPKETEIQRCPKMGHAGEDQSPTCAITVSFSDDALRTRRGEPYPKNREG